MQIRVCLDTVYCWKLKIENWKYCSKIIFKCVNSIMGPSFKEKFAKIHTCRSCEQYIEPKKNTNTKGLFGLEQFWIISLKTHNWVLKTRGTHTNVFVWLDFDIVFPSLKTQKFWVRVMETENNKWVFSVFENWVSVAFL